MTVGEAAAGVAVACLLADLLLVLAMAVSRTARRRREQRDLAHRRRLQPLVMGHLLTDRALDPADITRAERRVLVGMADDLAVKVRGDARRRLAALLVEMGGMSRAVVGARRPGALRRARSMQLFGLMAPVAGQALFELEMGLADRSVLVRATAARALGRAADPSSTPRILAAVDDDRRLAPGPAAQAVLRMGPGAAPELEAAVSNAGPSGRALAAELLGRAGSVAALPALVVAVASDPDDAVRVSAARALGRVGSPRGVGPVTEALAPDRPDSLREAAAGALGRIGGPSGVDALVGAVHEGPDAVASQAASALVRCGPGGLARLDQMAAGGGRAAEHAREALGRHHLVATAIGLPPQP